MNINRRHLVIFVNELIKAYHHVRWRWWNKIDADKVSKELSDKYKVEIIPDHGWDLELTYLKEARDRFLIKSDTLTVFLSIYRVVMVQKKRAPFTKKDVELRNRMIELFPFERSTFLPMHISSEPEFETVEEAETG